MYMFFWVNSGNENQNMCSKEELFRCQVMLIFYVYFIYIYHTGTYLSFCLWVIFGGYFEVMRAAIEARESEKAAVLGSTLQRKVSK